LDYPYEAHPGQSRPMSRRSSSSHASTFNEMRLGRLGASRGDARWVWPLVVPRSSLSRQPRKSPTWTCQSRGTRFRTRSNSSWNAWSLMGLGMALALIFFSLQGSSCLMHNCLRPLLNPRYVQLVVHEISTHVDHISAEIDFLFYALYQRTPLVSNTNRNPIC
jgi:hypothetical protein